jgi:hypothetical protein
MSLLRIDFALIPEIDATLPPTELVPELCRLLNETMRLLVMVNNECVDLHNELDRIRRLP